MFICKYCGTEFTEHKPNCPNCGAPIKASKSTTTSASSLREVCLHYEGTDHLFIDETIDKKRMETIRASFQIPKDETVIMVYDDTIFGNNKVGFAICTNGLYWGNDWSVESKRKRLTWEEFATREIRLVKLQISLGKGDNLGVAGNGSDEVRETIEKMLREIRELLNSA